MTAIFAQPTADENLVPGWNVQGNNGGTAGNGYATAGAVPPAPNLSSALQGSAGFPYPPKAEDVGSENDGASGVSILTNPGYATGNGTILGAITAPTIPASGTALANPSGLAAQVSVTGGTLTEIQVAPFTAAGVGSAVFTEVAAGDAAGSAPVVVPGGGWIKLTYSVVPTSWSWVTTN